MPHRSPPGSRNSRASATFPIRVTPTTPTTKLPNACFAREHSGRIDFLFRAGPLSKFSLVAITSEALVKYLPGNNDRINAGPKIFAARIGLLLTSLIIVLFILKLSSAAFFLVGILALFSFLESVFAVCVACIIYPYVYKFTYKLNFTSK